MKEELLRYGLNDKEADIYLACLKSGELTANRLSEITEIRRSTVYEVLAKLKKKGIITSINKEKKLYFNAVNPQGLIDLLKEKEDVIENILPDLKKIMNSMVNRPGAELYEGIKSIKPAVLEMLHYNEILAYGATTEGEEIFEHFISNFERKRIDKKVLLKGIFGETIPKHTKNKEVLKYTSFRKLKVFENHKVIYFLYGDNLLLISLGENLIAVKIKDPILVESQKQIFSFLWKIAK